MKKTYVTAFQAKQSNFQNLSFIKSVQNLMGYISMLHKNHKSYLHKEKTRSIIHCMDTIIFYFHIHFIYNEWDMQSMFF